MSVCVSAADLGFRADSTASAIFECANNKARLVAWLVRRPEKGKPLQPSIVLAEIAKLARHFSCHSVWSDFHYSETAREELAKHRVQLKLGPTGASGNVEVWTTARQLILEGKVVVPRIPALLAQLKEVRAKPTSGGGLSIEQPRRNGSHGDLASAFALGLWAARDHIKSASLGAWKYEPAGSSRQSWGSPSSRRDPLGGWTSAGQIGGPWQDSDEGSGAAKKWNL